MFPTKLTLYSSDGSSNWVINDRATQTKLWAQSPYYYISAESVDGLYSSDISYETHPIPNEVGEFSGDVFRRGKTVTITGNVTALSLGALERGVDYLYQAFADTGRRKLLWTRLADGVAVYLKCRINQDLAVVANINSFQFQYSYTVGLRADEPRTRKNSDDTFYPTWQ